MTDQSNIPTAPRGGAPVGFLTELPAAEAAAVLYLRLWSDGDTSRDQMRKDFQLALGDLRGARQFDLFSELCTLCVSHGRRPLMRHHLGCKCLGADESCFANFIGAAAEGAREDAVLIATLIVRPDIAFGLAEMALQVGLAFRQMAGGHPSHSSYPISSSLH